jgi:hypothetical protein
VAQMVAIDRAADWEELREARKVSDAEETAISEWFDGVQAVADAAMIEAAFHKHKGPMAEETGVTEVDVVVSRSAVEKVMPADKVDAIVRSAVSGDRSCLPDVQALLADPECGADFRTACGSSAERLRQSLIKKAAEKNILAQECIAQELDRVRRELEGPNPTPIERLLAERASLCWHIVNL